MFYALAFLCLMWLVLTVIVQFDTSLTLSFARFDPFGFLPRWTFFAPNPAHTDFRVLVRFENSSGITSWYELWLTSRIDNSRVLSRILFRGFFNPYRRIEKLLSDYRNLLVESGITPTQIRLGSEYIALLAIAEGAALNQGAKSVQFLLAETNYSLSDQFTVVLISDMHNVLLDR